VDRFFVNSAPAPGDYTLTGDEAHHLAAVRRIGPGERISLFCGDG
jgi:16S rRNA (uracil1498-N3)-methyltransferase